VAVYSSSLYTDVASGYFLTDSDYFSTMAYYSEGTRKYAVPFCADMDNDGDMDCIIGAEDGSTYYYENHGPSKSPAFNFSTRYYIEGLSTLPSSFHNAAPFCADFDNDGDLDCMLGHYSGSTIYYYENTGSASESAFTKNDNYMLPEATSRNTKVWCGDMDEDGDLDCLVGGGDGKVWYMENTGSASVMEWSRESTDYFDYDVGENSIPWCIDMDSDGDVDCLVGAASGYVFYFENVGSASSASWESHSTDFFDYDFGAQASPWCGDLTDDGEIDCLIGGSDGSNYGIVFYMENIKILAPLLSDWDTSFSEIDDDEDGFISISELASFFRSKGKDPTTAELQAVMDADDVNDDSMVSKEEWRNTLRRQRTKFIMVQGLHHGFLGF